MGGRDQFEKLVPILHEDDDLIAVVKPPGLDAGKLPEGGRRGIAEILGEIRDLGEYLEPANRLSRYESGVLLLAKRPPMLRHIRTGLRTGKLQQEYLAVVKGDIKGRRLSIQASEPGKPESRRKTKVSRRTPVVPSSCGTGFQPVISRAGSPCYTLKTRATPLKTGATRRQADRGESVNVSVLQRRSVTPRGWRLLIRCTTNVRSTHALRAILRSAYLHVVGDDAGRQAARGARAARGTRATAKDESVQRTCLHLARIAFHHPAAKKKITITAPPPVGFDDVVQGRESVDRMLTAALAARVQCLLDDTTDAFRLLSGDAEGVPGLVVEKYGSVVVLQIMEDRCKLAKTAQRRIGRFYMNRFNAVASYRKVFVKDRTRPDAAIETELRSPKPFLGRTVEPVIEVLERGMKLEIRPYDGYAVGVFLDHRLNRARVRDLAEGKRVLNLFAYTCGFSVAAALGGAESVVSVDISKSHLEWGKANFARNDLPLEWHQFIASDAFDYFKRARRQNKKFDLIIMDPPTFARIKKPKRTFSITQDLPELVAGALSILDRRGVLMVSTNCRQLAGGKLIDLVRAGGDGRRHREGESKDHLCSTLCLPRRLRVIDTPPLPPDFAADPQHAKTVFLRAV